MCRNRESLFSVTSISACSKQHEPSDHRARDDDQQLHGWADRNTQRDRYRLRLREETERNMRRDRYRLRLRAETERNMRYWYPTKTLRLQSTVFHIKKMINNFCRLSKIRNMYIYLNKCQITFHSITRKKK